MLRVFFYLKKWLLNFDWNKKENEKEIKTKKCTGQYYCNRSAAKGKSQVALWNPGNSHLPPRRVVQLGETNVILFVLYKNIFYKKTLFIYI